MNRPIKFRAWDSISKKMFTPDAILNDESGRALLNGALKGTAYSYSPEHFPVMQFTGLYDHHGNEVWEGDILAPLPTGIRQHNRICEWVDGSFCYSPKQGGHGFWALNSKKSKYFEVIGNIYENPELLSHPTDNKQDERSGR